MAAVAGDVVVRQRDVKRIERRCEPVRKIAVATVGLVVAAVIDKFDELRPAHRLGVDLELGHLHVGTGSTRFDPNLDEHHHLVCESCKAVVRWVACPDWRQQRPFEVAR